jgi:hypothetical protein
MEVSGQRHAPGEGARGRRWIGEWVGPRAGPNCSVTRNVCRRREQKPGRPEPASSVASFTAATRR